MNNKYGLTSVQIKQATDNELVTHIAEQLINNDFISYATFIEVNKRNLDSKLVELLMTKGIVKG